jgi:hypothetical protein
MKNFISANHLNKSQLIRDVYSVNPAATNREIKRVIYEQYGFVVGSNLISQAIGSQLRRKTLGIRTSLIVAKCRDILNECGNDIEFAVRCLRLAG